MKKNTKSQRNWPDYNAKLRRSASIELYISEEVLQQWYYEGQRKAGGVLRYADPLIEAILCVREVFHLALRQTQGFMESLLKHWLQDKTVPHYSTLCRRMQKLEVTLNRKLRQLKQHHHQTEGLVLAIDSTGLSIFKQDSWHNRKHRTTPRSQSQTWRKLHICLDTDSGQILSATYSQANSNDGEHLPALLDALDNDINIQAVCADKAYDTANCRHAIQQKQATERIDIRRDAKHTRHTGHGKRLRKQHPDAFKNRDWQLDYINHNAINGCTALARKTLKQHIGYHRRSLVETAMWRIKAHSNMLLASKREDSRQNQALIKCKIANIVNAL